VSAKPVSRNIAGMDGLTSYEDRSSDGWWTANRGSETRRGVDGRWLGGGGRLERKGFTRSDGRCRGYRGLANLLPRGDDACLLFVAWHEVVQHARAQRRGDHHAEKDKGDQPVLRLRHSSRRAECSRIVCSAPAPCKRKQWAEPP
jgi:hypothetical protein